MTLPEPTEGALQQGQNLHSGKVIKNVAWTSGARSLGISDLLILGCELHQNAFGSARTCWGSYSVSPDPLAAIRGGVERVDNRERGKGREGSSEGR